MRKVVSFFGSFIEKILVVHHSWKRKVHRKMIQYALLGNQDYNSKYFEQLSDYVDIVTICVSILPKCQINDSTHLGKIPSLVPILPVHQSVSLSVLLIIVMISPFLKLRSPSCSPSNVNFATA
jgi:hypothetical protein